MPLFRGAFSYAKIPSQTAGRMKTGIVGILRNPVVPQVFNLQKTFSCVNRTDVEHR